MFLMPMNLFDQSMPNMFAMTSADGQRCAGHLEPLLYSPLSPVYKLTEKEMKNIPYRIIIFGDFTSVPKFLKKYFYHQYIGQKFIYFSNFIPSEKLIEMLRSTLKECSTIPEDAYKSNKLKSIVEWNRVCRQQFDLESWEAEQKGK